MGQTLALAPIPQRISYNWTHLANTLQRPDGLSMLHSQCKEIKGLIYLLTFKIKLQIGERGSYSIS